MQQVQLAININTQQALRGIGQLNSSVSTTLNTITDLEDASAALNQQLRNTQRGTQAFNDLSAQLNVVNTELRNAELNLEVLDNEQLVGSVKGLAGGLTDIAGGLTLIGVSGEGMEKIAQTFAQVEGASKVIGGALDTYNEGLKVVRALVVRATAAHTALVASTTAQTAATTGLTTAQTAQANISTIAAIKMKALNLVMNANPVLLLVTGVALLAGGLYALTRDTDTAKKSQEELTKAFADSAKNVADVKQKVNEVGVAFNAAKRGITSKKEALKIYNETLGASLGYAKNFNEAERLYNSKTNAYIKATTLRSQAQALAALSSQKYVEAFEKSQKVELTNLQVLQLAKTQALKGEKAALEQGKEFVRQNREEANKQLTKDIEALNKQSALLLAQALEVESKAGITSVEIEETKQDGKKEVVKKSNDDVLKLQNEFIKKYLTGIFKVSNTEQKELVKINKANLDLQASRNDDADEALLKRTENIEAISELEYQLNGDLIGLNKQKLINLEAQKNRELELAGKNATERERIELEYALKEKEIIDDTAAYRAQKNIDFVTDLGNSVQQVTDIIGQILQQRNEMEASIIDKRYNQEEEALKNSLANRLISQKEYDSKIAIIEQKKAEDEKKLKMKIFNQNKAIALANATMATALAVVQAFAQTGPIAGAIFAGIAAAAGAAQIGIIASQKFTAARGGVVPGSGPSTIDSVDALLAPGEMVINANSARMFAPILSDINQAGGGVALAPSRPDNGTSSNNGGRQIVEAYVVESQITNVQNRVNRFKKRKEF